MTTDSPTRSPALCDDCGQPIPICNARAMLESAIERCGEEATLAALGLCRPDRSPAGEVRDDFDKVIAERDAMEGAFSAAYEIIMGREMEWTSAYDTPEALSDMAERVAAFSLAPAPERERRESIIDRMAEAIYRADDHPPGPALSPLFLKTKTGPLHERQREKYRAMARAALVAYEEKKDG